MGYMNESLVPVTTAVFNMTLGLCDELKRPDEKKESDVINYLSKALPILIDIAEKEPNTLVNVLKIKKIVGGGLNG